jgi:hypothetical protein
LGSNDDVQFTIDTPPKFGAKSLNIHRTWFLDAGRTATAPKGYSVRLSSIEKIVLRHTFYVHLKKKCDL